MLKSIKHHNIKNTRKSVKTRLPSGSLTFLDRKLHLTVRDHCYSEYPDKGIIFKKRRKK